MKTPFGFPGIKSIYFIVMVISLSLIGCEKEYFLDDSDNPSALKSEKIKVMPSTANDVLTKAGEDWQNINDALQGAGPGEVVQLAEGLFYLHKSIIRWDFNGTLKGSGKNKTTIQTVPGELFDVSECPPLKLSWKDNDGFFMFCFAHHDNDEMRTVRVSDLTIIVDEPTTPYYQYKNHPTRPPEEGNTIQALHVQYENLDNDMANPINLNVIYKNIKVIGDKDNDKYLNTGYSLYAGLAAFGASSGKFEAKNVHVTDANQCILPIGFSGDDATVTVKNSSLNSCIMGINSFLNHSWTIKDNEIENSRTGIVMLKKGPSKSSWQGSDGISFIKDNRVHFVGGIGLGVQFVKNVQVKDNYIEGSGRFGIAIVAGDNWIIKDNDLCGVNALPIFIVSLTNSEIKENANQVIGGPGASDPTIIIGEPEECDNDNEDDDDEIDDDDDDD